MNAKDQQVFELEAVGQLWERIHNADYRLISVTDFELDENGFPLEIRFKFEKVI